MSTLRSSLVWLAPAFATVTLSACAAGYHVKQGDTLARAGDWEMALAQYRTAVAKNPDDTIAVRRMWRAERKAIAIWTKRGNDANAQGRLGEAGTWWRKAIEASDPLERESSGAWRAVEENATALEYHGDVSFREERWEEAIATWGALLLVQPDRVDVVEKNMGAQRRFAAELHDRALSLARRDLYGAALVTDLRALRYDPMQGEAFSAGSELRRTLRSRTRVAVQEIRMVDQGYKALGAPLLARLTPHLEDAPPYGPTRDRAAKRASFVVTIEELVKEEPVVEGVDELVNDEPPATEPIPNPAIPEHRRRIAELEASLAKRQGELAAEVKARRPQPYGEDRGLALAREIDRTKQELAAANAALAKLPAKVPPPAPPATWTLPWKETTRTLRARVRFELSEPDFPEPVVRILEAAVSHSDRSHEGSARHRLPADPLRLPEWEAMTVELATRLEGGAGVLAEARQRRVDALLERGRAHLGQGRESEALDAFVEVMFLTGPQSLPEDAAAFVAGTLEHDRFKDVVAVQ